MREAATGARRRAGRGGDLRRAVCDRRHPFRPSPQPTRRRRSRSSRSARAVTSTPIFIVHGAGGNVLFLWSLARAMSGTRPIYGFQALGVDGSDMPDATVEEMASRYVAELRAAHSGPYLLGGYSGGGVVTFEMVRQLEAIGEEVKFVVLFDSVPPGKAEPPPKVARRNILRNIRRHGIGPLKPYIKAHLKWSLQKFLPVNVGRTEQQEADKRELGLRDVHDFGFVNLFYYFSAAADKYQMGAPIKVDAALLKAEWVWPSQPARLLLGQVHRRRDRRRRRARRPQRDVLPGERAAARRGAHADPRTSRLTRRHPWASISTTSRGTSIVIGSPMSENSTETQAPSCHGSVKDSSKPPHDEVRVDEEIERFDRRVVRAQGAEGHQSGIDVSGTRRTKLNRLHAADKVGSDDHEFRQLRQRAEEAPAARPGWATRGDWLVVVWISVPKRLAVVDWREVVPLPVDEAVLEHSVPARLAGSSGRSEPQRRRSRRPS